MLGASNAEKIRSSISRLSDTGMRQATSKRAACMRESQELNNFEDYLTEAMWTLLRSEHTITTKLISAAEFIVDTLGLHYPTDMTMASIVGTIVAAHGKQMSFQ